MLKFVIGFLLLMLAANAAFADPWDCMTKDEAKALVAYLKKNPYVMDYCDCCNQDGTTAQLLYIQKAVVKPCEYDAERFSVEVTALVLSENTVNKEGSIMTSQANAQMPSSQLLLSLNYHYTVGDGTNLPLLYALPSALSYEDAGNCGAELEGYCIDVPAAHAKKYYKWLKNKGMQIAG